MLLAHFNIVTWNLLIDLRRNLGFEFRIVCVLSGGENGGSSTSNESVWIVTNDHCGHVEI